MSCGVSEQSAVAVKIGRPVAGSIPLAQLTGGDPYLGFARALELFYEAPRPAAGVHPTASIAESAQMGEGASIGAYAVIGEDAEIGPRAVIHPHVVVYPGVRIGADFLWLQYDVISDAGVAIAEAGGVRCIVDRCIKVEHARLR